MTATDLAVGMAELADHVPPIRAHDLATRALAGSARRRRRRRIAAPAAAAVIGVVGAAVVGLQALPGNAGAGPGVVGSSAQLSPLPPVPARPLPLVGHPIRSASLVLGWAHGATAGTLVLGAHGEGYRLLPGQGALTEVATSSRCAGSLSPDGTKVACSTGAGTFEVITLATGQVKRIAARGAHRAPVWWSPDGTRFAALTGGGIIMVNGRPKVDTKGDLLVVSLDSRVRRIPLAYAALSLGWSPDGTRIAVLSSALQGLRIYDLANGGFSQVLPFETYQSARRHSRPSLGADSGVVFTADGRDLLVVAYTGGAKKPPFSLLTLGPKGQILHGVRVHAFTHVQPALVGLRGGAVLVQADGAGAAPSGLFLVEPATGRSTALVTGRDEFGPGAPTVFPGQPDPAWIYAGPPMAVLPG